MAGTLLAMANEASALTASGNFVLDADYTIVPFSLLVGSTVTIETTSYANGGFDPLLTLVGPFSGPSGSVIAENDDKDFINNILDSFISIDLSAGNYEVVITQSLNQLNGASVPPYTFTKTGNFTGTEYGCSQGSFCNYSGENRGTNWSLNITAVPTVAEPETLALMGLGLTGLFLSRRGKKDSLRKGVLA